MLVVESCILVQIVHHEGMHFQDLRTSDETVQSRQIEVLQGHQTCLAKINPAFCEKTFAMSMAMNCSNVHQDVSIF